MRLRKRHLLWLLVLLAALPAIPAMAGPEPTTTVEAVNEPGSGLYAEEHHSWTPVPAMVATGGTVAFKNPGAVPHGVEWINPPSTPTCTGVPVGTTPAASGSNWSGSCTFAQAGVYTFYCTVHGPAMTGRVVVGATGITTVTMSTTQSSSSGTATTPGAPGAPGSPTAPGSLTTGSTSRSLALAKLQHGSLVRGSVEVAQDAAGGKLEIELLAKKAALSAGRHTGQTRVGKLERSALKLGPVSFKVALNASARHALRARRRLALKVEMILTPAHGVAVTVTRNITLHV